MTDEVVDLMEIVLFIVLMASLMLGAMAYDGGDVDVIRYVYPILASISGIAFIELMRRW